MDRNFSQHRKLMYDVMSPPAGVAWIETPGGAALWQTLTVATRGGGVDRNMRSFNQLTSLRLVATREGGVDRNRVLK